MERIVDIHSHAFPDKVEPQAVQFLAQYYNFELNLKATVEAVTESAKKAGITKLFLHSTATTPSQVENVNNFMSETSNDYITCFGSIHPDYNGIENELNRIEKLGLKGIKLHPEFQKFFVNDKKMFSIYEMIGDRFVLLIHAGDENYEYSRPKYIAQVIENFPKLKVIAAHLGGYTMWDEAEEYLYGKNLYLDTSSTSFILSPEKMVEIIRKHGIDKVFFGTDYPICTHEEEVNRFKRLKLTDEEIEKVLWKNAYDFFDIKD